MTEPDYIGGNRSRSRGGGFHRRRWGQPYGFVGNDWLDRVGTWIDGPVPSYAGQGQPMAGNGGTPVYKPAPSSTGTASVVATTLQPDAAVIVAPRR